MRLLYDKCHKKSVNYKGEKSGEFVVYLEQARSRGSSHAPRSCLDTGNTVLRSGEVGGSEGGGGGAVAPREDGTLDGL